MRCPFCKDEKGSKVLDSRESSEGFVIRRRRECLSCERRFTTYERVEEAPLTVIKKDGRREPFQRKKILESLERSCQKRPIGAERLAEIAEQLEREIREIHDREVPSKFIGELLMRELRKLDKVAYVRYASLYRNFQELSDFLDELKPLLEAPEARE
ncbi:transcriptional repressor NrdR [bacterium]|nr:transcriptional repressor NrdR [bacterium]